MKFKSIWILRSLPNFLWPLKIFLLKKSLKKVGKNFKCGPNIIIGNHKNCEIGNNVFIGDGSVIGSIISIKIGNNVMFGPEVMIRGGDHNISEVGKPMIDVKTGGFNNPIIIEDDVWIGARALILKGSKISEGAVIGAGSIVTKDVLPYSINYGTPSKPIKCRFDKKGLEIHLTKVNSNYHISNLLQLYASHNIRIE